MASKLELHLGKQRSKFLGNGEKAAGLELHLSKLPNLLWSQGEMEQDSYYTLAQLFVSFGAKGKGNTLILHLSKSFFFSVEPRGKGTHSFYT